MPECRHAVGGKETTAGTNVNVLRQPIGSLLIPRGTQRLEVWRRFKLNHVNVVRYLPSLGIPLGVKSLESGIPNIIGPLRIHPGKVVFEPNEEKGQPRIPVTCVHRFGQHFLRDKNRGGILRIIGIQEGVHPRPDNEDSKTRETAEEGAHRGPHLTRDLPLRLPRLIVQKRPVAGVGVKFVLVRRTSEDGREAEGVSQKFDNSGEGRDGNVSAFLRRPILLSFVDQFSVVKIVSEGVELHGEHHLRSREVHVPSEIIDVLAVQVSAGDVGHHEYRDERFGHLGGENEEHDVDGQGTDQLVDPLDSDRKLK
mmetsp:Transcript_25849/g.53970  ORF Transcript_25849/g.53970 Transcript_25849/m.53970 type:complete len:310 (+) Transcript_25849:477-1406(+)